MKILLEVILFEMREEHACLLFAIYACLLFFISESFILDLEMDLLQFRFRKIGVMLDLDSFIEMGLLQFRFTDFIFVVYYRNLGFHML